jgi:hypothetical protein
MIISYLYIGTSSEPVPQDHGADLADLVRLGLVALLLQIQALFYVSPPENVMATFRPLHKAP